jgi:hypothetical protein
MSEISETRYNLDSTLDRLLQSRDEFVRELDEEDELNEVCASRVRRIQLQHQRRAS